MRFSTKVIRVGQDPQPPHFPVIPPPMQSATFYWPDPDNPPEFDYTRAGNPTRHALEQVYAAIENAKYGLAQATGMAAITTACSLLRPGDHLLAPSDIYGGTYRLFETFLKPMGIEVTYAVATDPDAFSAGVKSNTRMVWLETPTNPTLQIVDLERCAAIAKNAGALAVVDNTFATPYLQNPLDLGCDIVMHSTTKYINGHSDVVGGALMWNDDTLTEPLTLYAKSTGNTPSPFECWLTLRGLKTLPVRMDRHVHNAQVVANFLSSHPKVERVYYPGLPSHPRHDIAKKQMRGFGGMVSFTVSGDAWAALQVASRLQVFLLAESLGGVESLVCYPPKMSHAAMSEEERLARGIPPNLLRLSVGIEDEEDLIEDLDQALR
ncbi:MAG: cystathionine gamma-synthase [Armatimonadota bacterium]